MEDLFENVEKMPIEILDLVIEFNQYECTYQDCELLLKKCLEIGYTFDFGLDAIPFNLRKI